MRQKTCCFTGHRDLPTKLLPAIRRQTSEAIKKLITENHVRYFGVGGAIGYDTLAAEVLFELKKIYPHKVRHLHSRKAGRKAMGHS